MGDLGQILPPDPDDCGENSKLTQSIVAVFIGLLVAGGWVYFLSAPRAVNRFGGAGATELSLEFNKIPAPKGVTAAGELLVSSKSYSNLVRQEYSTRNSVDKIVGYYDSILIDKGWVYLRYIYGGRGVGKIYCKNGNEASVEILDDGSGGIVRYSLSITSGDVASHECSRK